LLGMGVEGGLRNTRHRCGGDLQVAVAV